MHVIGLSITVVTRFVYAHHSMRYNQNLYFPSISDTKLIRVHLNRHAYVRLETCFTDREMTPDDARKGKGKKKKRGNNCH